MKTPYAGSERMVPLMKEQLAMLIEKSQLSHTELTKPFAVLKTISIRISYAVSNLFSMTQLPFINDNVICYVIVYRHRTRNSLDVGEGH